MIMINEVPGRTPCRRLLYAMLAKADRSRSARAEARRSGTDDIAHAARRPPPGASGTSFLDRLLASTEEADADLHDWLEAWGLGVLAEGGAASLKLVCEGTRVGGMARRAALALVDETMRAVGSASVSGRIHVAVMVDLIGPALLVRVEVLASALSTVACDRALAEVVTLARMGHVTMTTEVDRNRALVDLALPAWRDASGRVLSEAERR